MTVTGPSAGDSTGCPDTWPATGPTAGRRVLIIGDSLTKGSWQETQRLLLPQGWALHARCKAGQDLAWGVRELKRAKARGALGNDVIVALGTNDVGRAHPCTQVSTVMQALGTQRNVWWVNFHLRNDSPRARNAQAANACLQSASKRWPNLVIIDYDTAFTRYEAQAHGTHMVDALHPDQAGFSFRASVIAQALGNAEGLGAHPWRAGVSRHNPNRGRTQGAAGPSQSRQKRRTPS